MEHPLAARGDLISSLSGPGEDMLFSQTVLQTERDPTARAAQSLLDGPEEI